jgi:hypothetical protein
VSLTVVTAASSLRLTTRARVKTELNVTSTTDDAFYDTLIDQASAACASYCNRVAAPFARQSYTETLGAFGDVYLQLQATPIVTVSAVLQDLTPLTDYSIEDPLQGLLYRANQFFWTAQINPGLTGRQIWPMLGSPIPGAEEPRFSVSYVAGYILPAADLAAKVTISASSVDNSFNDSASQFSNLLQAGDIITVSGFANAANNGRFILSGTPTTSKLIATAATPLTTEIAGPAVTMTLSTLPGDLEKACIEIVKSWWANRSNDGLIIEKQMLGARIVFGQRTGNGFVPPLAAALLNSYRRAA